MTDPKFAITTLHHLLDYDARKFVSSEIQLKNRLQSWILIANSVKLKQVLQKYLDQVNEHLLKLERFINVEEISSLAVTNRIMKAFIEETDEKLADCSDLKVKDACLLACIQSINHFKISNYGTAAAFAQTLEMGTFARLFHEIEVNEKQIDDRLTQLAIFEINAEAKNPIALGN